MQMQQSGGKVEQSGLWTVTSAPWLAATATRTTLTPSASSQTLLAANTGRMGARIIIQTTDTTQRFFIKAGSNATVSDFCMVCVGAGEHELFDGLTWPYTGLYSIISTGTTGTIQVIELTA